MRPIFSKPSVAGLVALAAGLLVSFHIAVAAPHPTPNALPEIQGQMKQGQYAKALERIEKYIAAHPQDAQGRFLRGVILGEMGRPVEAIAIYTKLTEDFPALPEPYNNLAVLYAQQKQFDKARKALEMAIRTHPSYSVAHENLGDIYAQLASQSYDRALQREPATATPPARLEPIRELGTVALQLAPRSATASHITPASQNAVPAAPRRIPESRTAEPPPAGSVAAESSSVDGEIARIFQHWKATWSRLDFTGAIAYTISDLTCRIMRERVNGTGLSTGPTNPNGASTAMGAMGCRSEIRKSRFW